MQCADIGKCVVEYGCFVLGADDWGVEHKTMGFVGNWTDDSIYYCGLDNSKEFEVLGNIYEHKHLLEVPKP